MSNTLSYLTVEEKAVLNDIKKALAKLLHGRTYRFVLFGSKARGDFDKNSDIDLAIVVEGLDRNLKNAIIDTIADVELEHLLYVSTIILSTEEFQHLRARERRIALDIDAEGIDV